MDESNIPIRYKTFVKEDPITPESKVEKSTIFRRQDFLASSETQETNEKAFPQQLEHILQKKEEFCDDKQIKDFILHQRTVKTISEEESERPQDTDSLDNSSMKKIKFLERVGLKYKIESERPQDTDSLDNSSMKKIKFLERVGLKYKRAKTNTNTHFTGKQFKGMNEEVQNKMTSQNKTPNIFKRKKKVIQVSKENKNSTEFQDFIDLMSRASINENSAAKSSEMSPKSKSLRIFGQKGKYTLQSKQDIELSEEKKKFFTEFQDFTDSMSEKSSSENSETKSVKKPLKNKLSNVFRREKKDIKISESKKKIFSEFQDFSDSMSEGSSNENSETNSSEMPLKRKPRRIFGQKGKYTLQSKKDIELSEEKKKFFAEFQDFTDSMSEKSSSENSETKSVKKPLKNKLANVFRKEKKDFRISKSKKKIFSEFQDFPDSMSEGSSSEDAKAEISITPLKGKSHKILRKTKKYIFPSDESTKISKDKKENTYELVNFSDSMSDGSNGENAKLTTDVLKKTLENRISYEKFQFPSATSAQSKDIQKKCLMKSSPASIRSIISNAADVSSGEYVWEHFKQHLKSNKNYFDGIMVDSSNKEKTHAFPESGNQVTESSTMTPKLKRIKSKLSDTFGKIDNTGKQRIVQNEHYEYVRNWIIEQIKDKQVVLKYSLLEGKHSRDAETKEKCIETAKNLQATIDELFDSLEDQDKLENIPENVKPFRKTSEGNTKKSSAKKIKYLENPLKSINTYHKLLKYLYKPLSSMSENENILKRINARSFRTQYKLYMITKKDRDVEGEELQCLTRSAVDGFCHSLKLCQLRVKSKISIPVTGSLSDFQNCIIDLRRAVEENLDCLRTLIPLANSVVFPLMSYLSLSRVKIMDIFEYLMENRPYLFSESTNENNAFFDQFCQRHFKDEN